MSAKVVIFIVLLIIGAAFFGDFLGTLGHEHKIQSGNPFPPVSHNPNSLGNSLPSFQYGNSTR